jgi:type I restriction enzyme M protein
MFVQSAEFIQHRKADKAAELACTSAATEKTLETVKLAKMNLAVNGLRGDIKQANTYYEDPFSSLRRLRLRDGQSALQRGRREPLDAVEKDKRFNTYGMPRNKTKAQRRRMTRRGKETVPNANYLWINLFATSLKAQAAAPRWSWPTRPDARHSEADIRRTLIEQNLIYGMLTLPSNMFYTVTLPATLWFFDKGKADKMRMLFIDARNIFTQIDRAHREFSDEQIQNIAIISRACTRAAARNSWRWWIATLHQGIVQLHEAAEHLPGLSRRLLAVLAEEADEQTTRAARDAIAHLEAQWAQLAEAGHRRRP